ncbi:MAG: nucleoside monophosphate kinase [Patescibacteria group bacterium]|nr:nucleoside monophosphate kinase [Patescibacteria group bacterium]
MNIILLGPQGSGKGTQARMLSEKLGLVHVDVGAHLRNLSKNDQKLDKIINEIGALLPDKEVFAIVTKYLKEIAPDGRNILFDGYPRGIRQYNLMKNWLIKKGTKFDAAIYLDIKEKESVRRLSARRVCCQCGAIYNLITNLPPRKGYCACGGRLMQREDDKPRVIRKRLALYYQQTAPLVDFLTNEGILIRVDGEKPIEIVFQTILSRLGI